MPKRKPLGRQKESKRFRSITSFERRPGQRQPRLCLLIVCEGQETEPIYFDELRRELKLTLVEVQVEVKGSAPITIVDHALARREAQAREAKRASRKGPFNQPPFDEVWCVFDRDGHESFTRAINKARDNGLELAISVPAFEYWYLLHFRETTQPFVNADELMKALRDEDCLPNYEKNLNVCGVLFVHTDVAIERADRLLVNHPDADNDFPNPSTSVFKLVKKLRGMTYL